MKTNPSSARHSPPPVVELQPQSVGKRGAAILVMVLGAVLVHACGGSGGDGDIGPKLAKLPEASFRASVRDDSGRGVVNAKVVLSGFESSPAWSDGNGRVDFFLSPSGRVLVQVVADGATASFGDALASLTLAATAGQDQVLIPVVHLADLAPSAGLPLVAGVLAAPVSLDDSATSGAVIDIAAGTTVAFGGATNATIRSGSLRADHIPPLIRIDGAPALVTRGIQVGPAGATFAPGADLSIPNDIGLRANERADLYELDPVTGVWQAIGFGEADATATTIRSLAPAVSRGSLFAFCVAAPAVATFKGQLQQPDLRRFLDRGRVRAGQVAALCDGAGHFTLAGIPISGMDGSALRPILSISGGRLQRPALEEKELDPMQSDLGIVPTDIEGVVDLRSLVIARGELVPFNTVNIGSSISPNGTITVSDRGSEVGFPAISDRYIGVLSTTLDPNHILRVLTLDGRLFLHEGKRNIDQSLFLGSEVWLTDNRGGTLIATVDPKGGGRMAAVDVFRRVGTDERFRETTREEFDTREDIGVGVEMVATLVTRVGTRQQFSACSVRDVIVGRAEFPLPRAPREPTGEFEAFGIVQGDFRIPFGPSAGPTPTFRVVTTDIESADRWLDATIAGESLVPRTPIFLDPERDGGTEFRRGMPLRGGHIAALRGETVGGRFEMQSMNFDTDQVYSPTTVAELPTRGPGTMVFDTDFVATDAYLGLDASIPPDALRSDIALLLPDKRAVEIARGHDGNLRRVGNDAVLNLPRTSTTSAGMSSWLVVLDASADLPGGVRRQRAIFDLTPTPSPSTPLLGVPQVNSPANGAIISQTAFTVDYTVPANTAYVVIRLHGEDGDVTRDWMAILPPETTSFTFRRLPGTTDEKQILAPGHYTLEVEAARITRGPALEQNYAPYQAVVARFVGIGAFEREADAISSVRIALEVVP